MLGLWRQAVTLAGGGVGFLFLWGAIEGITPGKLALQMLFMVLIGGSWAGYFLQSMFLLFMSGVFPDLVPEWIITFDDAVFSSSRDGSRVVVIVTFLGFVSTYNVNYACYLKHVMHGQSWNPFLKSICTNPCIILMTPIAFHVLLVYSTFYEN